MIKPSAVAPTFVQPAPAEEMTGEQSHDFDQARRAVACYCREMNVTIPAEGLISGALEDDADNSQSSEEGRERLLAATGIAVADVLAERPAIHAGWRNMLGAEHEDDCAATPRRLVLASTGELDGHDQRALERHLEGCLPCQAIEARVARAERAFDATFLLGADTPTVGAATPGAAAVMTDAAVTVGAIAAAGSGRTPRRIAAGLLISGVAVLGGGAIAVAALSGGSDRSFPPRPTGSTTAARISTPTRGAPTAHTQRIRTRHAAAHRHRAKHHKKAARASSTRAALTPAASSPAPSVQIAPAPVRAPPPVTPAPTQASSAGSISASQQGGGLPAQNAPTQTIGSLGSNPPKH